MTELILIRTNNSREVKKVLESKHIFYEIYQEPKQGWEKQEKKALQEWENLTDKELIAEWENLPDSENVSINN